MDLDDGFRLVQLLGQACVVALELFDPLVACIFGLATSLLCEAREGSLPALLAPCREVRGIEALATQQRRDLSGLGGPVGLLEYLKLVSGIMAPALCLGGASGSGGSRACPQHARANPILSA